MLQGWEYTCGYLGETLNSLYNDISRSRWKVEKVKAYLMNKLTMIQIEAHLANDIASNYLNWIGSIQYIKSK